MEPTYQITGPNFCAGVVLKNGRVVRAAPILIKHVRGMYDNELHDYCARKGYRIVDASEADWPEDEPCL